jgi:hypothetical protein
MTAKKPKSQHKKTGRPTDYNAEIAALICERVATSRLSLKKLCAKHDDLPDDTSINLWKLKNPEFSRQYIEAKRQQTDLIMETLDEAVDENIAYYSDEKGNDRIDSPSATIAIAKANNAKCYASKIAPKIYGDQKRIDSLEHDNDKLRAETLKLRAELDKKNEKEY